MNHEDATQLVLRVAPGLAPDDARALTQTLYLPVASRLTEAVRHAAKGAMKPFVASVGGRPGTGKSTLATVLEALLEADHGLSVAHFSLDDLYFSGEERKRLAERIHPLFEQRGPPGTHDVALGLSLVERLRRAAANARTALPRFDKLTDEPSPIDDWPVFLGKPDVLILDGWFWGAQADLAEGLDLPLNERERTEDPDGTWRRAVLAALEVGYPEFFSLSHFHVQLEAPSHAVSVRWRTEQGRDLLRRRGLDPAGHDPATTKHFLELFERVARLPRRLPLGVHVELDEAHLVRSLSETRATGQ